MNNEKKTHTAMPPRIKECTCEHKFQDELYGKWMRVMNPCKTASGTAYRCTVCGRVHE